MKNIKTYEGFLDFFKSKNQNSLVEECISEVRDLHLLRSEISRTIKTGKGEIQHNTSLTWLEKPYIVKYKLNVDESRTDRQKELFSNLLMGVIGILSLVIGIKDFIHHRKCKN